MMGRASSRRCDVVADPTIDLTEEKAGSGGHSRASIYVPGIRPIVSTLLGNRSPGLVVAVMITALAASNWLIGLGSGSKAPPSGAQIVGGTEAAPKTVIAILPFAGERDQADTYFAHGLTQDVINLLGRFSALTVMSWNTVSAYKSAPASPGSTRLWHRAMT